MPVFLRSKYQCMQEYKRIQQKIYWYSLNSHQAASCLGVSGLNYSCSEGLKLKQCQNKARGRIWWKGGMCGGRRHGTMKSAMHHKQGWMQEWGRQGQCRSVVAPQSFWTCMAASVGLINVFSLCCCWWFLPFPDKSITDTEWLFVTSLSNISC